MNDYKFYQSTTEIEVTEAPGAAQINFNPIDGKNHFTSKESKWRKGP